MVNALPRKYSGYYFLGSTILFTTFFITLGCFAHAQDTVKKGQVKQDTIKKDSVQLDTIHFSDRIWNIRNFTTETVGPGNNYWSADKTKNVWVDSRGFLHLKLTRDEHNPDKWYCAQVETQDSLGKGTYEFEVEGAIDKLNENVVLGLFSYPDDGIKSPDGFDEIDIEYSRWGERDNPANFDYAVWGDEHQKARKQIDFFYVSLRSIYTTQTYIRTGKKVKFESWAGFNSHKSRLYQTDVMPKTRRLKPALRDMPVMINLWLVKPLRGTKPLPPSDGKTVEIIIHSFTFTPE